MSKYLLSDGVVLFNGLCLFVLPDIQGNIFIQEATLTCLLNEQTLINEQAGIFFLFITWKSVAGGIIFSFITWKSVAGADYFFKNAKRACSFIRQVRVSARIPISAILCSRMAWFWKKLGKEGRKILKINHRSI